MPKLPTWSATLALLALVLISGPASAKQGWKPKLNEDQEKDLSKGKIVVLEELPTKSKGGIPVMGILDIDAPPAKVWHALFDWPTREKDSDVTKKITTSGESRANGEYRVTVQWDLAILGQDLTYTNKYVYWEADSYLEFNLDNSVENDLVYNWGSYYVIPHPTETGRSRFYYAAETDTGRKLPESIKSWLAKKGLRTMLKSIRDRAEP